MDTATDVHYRKPIKWRVKKTKKAVTQQAGATTWPELLLGSCQGCQLNLVHEAWDSSQQLYLAPFCQCGAIARCWDRQHISPCLVTPVAGSSSGVGGAENEESAGRTAHEECAGRTAHGESAGRTARKEKGNRYSGLPVWVVHEGRRPQCSGHGPVDAPPPCDEFPCGWQPPVGKSSLSMFGRGCAFERWQCGLYDCLVSVVRQAIEFLTSCTGRSPIILVR